jgi:hypothetical protein
MALACAEARAADFSDAASDQQYIDAPKGSAIRFDRERQRVISRERLDAIRESRMPSFGTQLGRSALFVDDLDPLVEPPTDQRKHQILRARLTHLSKKERGRCSLRLRLRTIGSLHLQPRIAQHKPPVHRCRAACTPLSIRPRAAADITLIFLTPGNHLHASIRCFAHDFSGRRRRG